MQRNSVPGLEPYAPALGLLDWCNLFGDVFRCLVDLNAVELRPIAGDPGGVSRVSVLALFYRQVDEDCVMQHESVFGDNLVCRKPLHSKYEKACKPVGDGWLVNTCSSSARKVQQIEEISDALNLGIKAEIC